LGAICIFDNIIKPGGIASNATYPGRKFEQEAINDRFIEPRNLIQRVFIAIVRVKILPGVPDKITTLDLAFVHVDLELPVLMHPDDEAVEESSTSPLQQRPTVYRITVEPWVLEEAAVTLGVVLPLSSALFWAAIQAHVTEFTARAY